MSRPSFLTPSRLAWSLCAVALALLVLSLGLISLGWLAPLPKGWISWQGLAINVVGIMGAPILGGLVASRRPENPYGWLWLGLGLSLALLQFAQCYATYALVTQPGSLPVPRTVGTLVAGIGWTAQLILLPFLFLLFPTGQPPSPRWRFLAWVVLAAGTLALILGPFVPGRSGFAPVENPFGVGGAAGEAIFVLANASVLVILVAIVPSALSLVFRYRRASGVERQQLKWLAYAAVLFAAAWFSQFFYEPAGAWDALFETVILSVLYVAVGVAILRHRLYDIDLLINRTLVYGALTISLALVYLGGVVSLQYVFQALTEQGSKLAVVVSTLAIAALFQPLRRRTQGFIDRRFYRKKYDAAKTLAAFNARLRDETDLDALSDDLITVVRETMQPEHASLWLKPSGSSRSAKERAR